MSKVATAPRVVKAGPAPPARSVAQTVARPAPRSLYDPATAIEHARLAARVALPYAVAVARPAPRSLYDPATAIEHARLAARVALPHAVEVERRLGVPVAGLEVHAGPEAAEACEALEARALTTWNVIAFPDARPRLSTVLHEVRHVVQQGAVHARAPRFVAGSLPLADPRGRAERAARSPGPVDSAPRAIYREELDEDPADAEVQPSTPNKNYPKTLLRTLLEVLKSKPIKRYSKTDYRYFKLLSEAEGAEPVIYAEASDPFTSEDLQNVAEVVKGAFAPEDADRKKKNFAQTRQTELFGVSSRNAKLMYRTTFVADTYKLRVSRAGAQGGDTEFRSYVFVGAAIPPGKTSAEPISDDNHFYIIADKTASVRSGIDVEQRCLTYKGIAEKVKAFIKEVLKKDETIKDATRSFDKLIERCDGLLLEFKQDPTKVKGEATTDEIRRKLRDQIIDNFEFLFDLHKLFDKQATDKDKDKGRTFAAVPGLQGSILAEWISTRYQGLEFDPKTQPVFDMSAFPVEERPDLPDKRKGDGAIPPADKESGDWVIAEAKGYTTDPTTSQIKQMQDYKRILTYKGDRRTEAQIKAGQLGLPGLLFTEPPQAIAFKRVHYFFAFPLTIPDEQDATKTKPNPIAEKWRQALLDNLGQGYYTTTPDPSKPQSFETYTQANPVFAFTIKNGDQLDHSFSDVAVKHPVVKQLKSVQLKLQYPREPYLASGKIVMDIDMKGAVKQDAVEKIIAPVPAEERKEKPKPGELVHGRFPSKEKGGTSALDKILAGIETEVGLTDKGLAATILVKEGKAKGFDFKQSTVTATLGIDGKVALAGTIKFAHQSGKVDGSITLSYDGKDWSFKGSATITDLFQGLKTFTITVSYSGAEEAAGKNGFHLAIPKLLYQRTFGGIAVTGTIENASYDVATESFNAENIALSAEMGAFGKATGSASIANNDLTKLAIDYQSPQLTYPKDSKKPLLSGALTGNITYKDDKFSGGIKGQALLDSPILQRLAKDQGPLGLAVDVQVGADGAFSGSIGTTTPIHIGKYFSIPSVTLTLRPDGEIAGKFGLSVHGIKYLNEATATCVVDKTGFDVEAFRIDGGLPRTETSRFWGNIVAEYSGQTKAFVVTIDAWVKIRDNLIGHGKLTYDSLKNEVNGSLDFGKIVLLSKDKTYDLFDLSKQIPLVNIWGLGLYLDFGAKAKFTFHLDLWVQPGAKVEGFSLDSFQFKSISATMTVGGGITATLTLEPFLGLGLFVLSPSVLRGGGGLKIPINGRASVDPSATVGAKYAPKDAADPQSEYELSSAAQLSLVVKFGIDAAIEPYATFVVLDGAYRKDWEGDPLKKFVILPERELFRYTVDFGKPIKAGDDPKMGPNPAAKPSSKAQVKEGKPGDAKTTVVDRTVKENPPDSGPQLEEPKKDEDDGFSFKSLLDRVKENPTYQKIDAIIEDALGVFRAIGKFFKSLYNFIKKWVGTAIDAIKAVLQGIAEKGLFGYLKDFLGGIISKFSPTLWRILEPLFTALAKTEDTLRDTLFALLDKPLPTSFTGFLEWSWDIVTTLAGGAWDSIDTVAEGIIGMFSAARSVAGEYVDELIKAGKIGVKWSTYDYFVTEREHPDVWKIHIGGLRLGANPSSGSFVVNTGTVVGVPLYLAFKAVGATPTSGSDYWVPADGDP
jgi:hypothetical protein